MRGDMTIWQNSDNCVWKTDKILRCSVCGKKSKTVINLKTEDDSIDMLFCFFKKRDCFRFEIERIFKRGSAIDFLYMRQIEFFKPQTERIPIGLSLRYFVLKRDKFKCCFCGRTGKDTTLEIDHKIPVSSGGSNNINNLQTLCFDCNRGKRDHD